MASGSAKFFLFNECFEMKFHNQLAGDHLTIATVISDLDGEDDDPNDDHALLLPFLADGRMVKNAKGKSTNACVIPQELPEPDDIAIAHVYNPQAEL